MTEVSKRTKINGDGPTIHVCNVRFPYPYSVGNTSCADHTVGVQPAAGGLVDKGAMARPLVASQLPSFHPCPPGHSS